MSTLSLSLEIEIINSLLETQDTVFICKPDKTKSNSFFVSFRTTSGYWNYVSFYSENKQKNFYYAFLGHLEMISNHNKLTFTFLDYAAIGKAEHIYEVLKNEAKERNEYKSFKKNKNICRIEKMIEVTYPLEEKSLLHLLERLSIEY